jgi:hypothetical protein
MLWVPFKLSMKGFSPLYVSVALVCLCVYALSDQFDLSHPWDKILKEFSLYLSFSMFCVYFLQYLY